MSIKNRIKLEYQKTGLKGILFEFNKQITKLLIAPFLFLYYKHKLENPVPNPVEIKHIDPDHLRKSYPSSKINSIKPFGILGGDWDSYGTEWQKGFWSGLEERFVESKEWEQTEYYEEGMSRLKSKGAFGPLDGRQDTENFKEYLDYLDNLFEDIKKNGYDNSSVITVDVGRDGDYLVSAGRHRSIFANLLELDEIPVRIRYVHPKWYQKTEDSVTDNTSLIQIMVFYIKRIFR